MTPDAHYPAADGWHYAPPTPEMLEGKDARKLVELHQGGMRWIGIRSWHTQGRYWMANGEPEPAEIFAWRDLPPPTRGFWNRGLFTLLPIAHSCDECGYVWTESNPPRHSTECHAQGGIKP